MNDGFTFAEGVPGETDARCYVTFRRSVGGLVERQKRLRGHIEILSLARTGGPGRVVVVSQSKIQGKSPGRFPIILQVEIPIGIAVADEVRVSVFCQNENAIVYKVADAAVVVGLLRPQPLVIPIDANLRAEIQGVSPDGLGHIVKNLDVSKRGDLIEGIWSGKRAEIREESGKPSEWLRGIRIRVGIKAVEGHAELVQQRRVEGVGLIEFS